MLHKSNAGMYVSTLLFSTEGFMHGFTTRAHKDMREKNNIDMMFGAGFRIVRAQQVHGNTIANITSQSSFEHVISEVDGVVMNVEIGNKVVLTVRTADCVPIIAVDRHARVIGVAHAGWKGTIKNIAEHFISEMVAAGAHQTEIRVVLGPSIDACCYNVTRDRASLFINAFGDDTKSVEYRGGKYYLNLRAALVDQLCHNGINASHIDASTICTASSYPEFFSYRKDSRESFGEMLGFIGYNNEVV